MVGALQLEFTSPVLNDLFLVVSSYLQYSSLCAKFLRRALKPEFREAAILKKEDTTAKVFQWKEGKPGPAGVYACLLIVFFFFFSNLPLPLIEAVIYYMSQ